MNAVASQSAIDLCSQGMSSIGRFQADAMQNIDASIKADDHYCLPKIVKAFMLQGAGDVRYSAEVIELIKQSQQLLPNGVSREAELLKAVSFASEGKGVEAATVLEAMLIGSPTDLFAHVMVQDETFWLGRSEWMLDIVERAAPAWAPTSKDYGAYLSLRAFANEEAGLFDVAEKYGRDAVEIDPTDVWGAHAVAHVLVMKGEIYRGIDWLEGLSPHWGLANQMRHHLWWHLCLFLLELGEYDRVVNLLDTEIRNPASPLIQASPAATIDINNYASLLLRLELYGVDVAIQWQTLAAICAERISNHGSAFSNVHDMMVLSASGQTERANELLQSMRERFDIDNQSSSVALSYRAVAIPVCEALLAYRSKDYAQVLSRLGGVRHQLQLMGASHAQRDVFYHLLVHAARHEGCDDLQQIYMRDIERLGFCDVPLRAAYR